MAATVNPAVFMGMADSLGTVETGKLADLVLLDANPLDDIRNTERIAAVLQQIEAKPDDPHRIITLRGYGYRLEA